MSEHDVEIEQLSQKDASSGVSPAKTWIVHFEVRVSPKTTARFDTIKAYVYSYLISSFPHIVCPSTLEGWEDIPVLGGSVERIIACESSSPSSTLPIEEILPQIHLYQPSETEPFEEFSNGPRFGNEEDVMTATMCELPNRALESLWDSLIYADNIKLKLLNYIYATLILSDVDVDLSLVSWNRVILLHGPPGTGKTSLCRALAQKISIRLSDRYAQTRLLEINSHSLFSKWFSESGKLVQKLFTSITELVDDEDNFVVVLIDEVESLTAARAGAIAGTEPSDGLRVVNALLTQLDKLKHRKNVLIMSTSNLPKAIDSAFIDRADIVQYIDLPPREAIYEILRTSLCEMIAKGAVRHATVPRLKEAEMYKAVGVSVASPTDKYRSVGIRLMHLADVCRKRNMSGRALRRLPVLALARYVGAGFTTSSTNRPAGVDLLNNGAVGGVQPAANNTIIASRGNQKHASLLAGAADVEVWLDAMEQVVVDSGEELGRVG